MRKFLLTFLTMFLCVVSAYAQSFEKDGLSYNVIKQQDAESLGEVEVRQSLSEGDGQCGGYAGDIVIPAEVVYDDQTYEVTKIRDWAFRLCPDITSVTIPNSVTYIGDAAFFGCTGLTSVTIPNSVITIEGAAFGGCSNLTSVIFGQKLTTIGTEAFISCSSLSSIIIPKRVTKIDERAFSSCSSLTSLIIGSGMKNINKSAFAICPELKDVYCYAEEVPSTRTDAFDESSPENATLHVPAVSIELYMAAEPWSKFGNIVALTDNDSPEANGLAEIDGIYYNLNPEAKTAEVTENPNKYSGEVKIPGTFEYDGVEYSVTSIGESAFSGCSGLSSVTIPNCVTSIGGRAFQDCSGLTSVTIPNGVTSIGTLAFYNCSGLISVSIPKSVTEIGGYAFQNCIILNSVTIPNSVTKIGAYTFAGCSGLTSINIRGNVTTIGDYAFHACSSLSSITIPSSVTTIGDYAFQGCESFSSVTLPNSVTSIGEWTFSYCSSLSSIILSDQLTTIEGRAFLGCESLSSITVPNSVTSIGDWAFYECRGLTSIKMGENVSSIGEYAFKDCSLSSITLPQTLESIGDGAFLGCGALASVIFEDGITTVGNGAFGSCPLKSIDLPNSITTIPEGCFSGNNFQYIKLGDNVQSIGKNAFGSRVESDEDRIVIEIATSTPPAIDKDAFPNLEFLEDINVIVPDAAAVTAYRKKAVWEDMTFTHQDNNAEVTVDTPGELSFELLSESGLKPAQVVGLKVNGTINADDFRQMLVNMKSLLRLDLSDCDITEIPDGALGGKTQLQELTLPDGLQAIGKNAFQGCPYLTGKLNLPSDVTTIGDYAFEGTNYTLVKMPYSLKTIGDYTFYNLPIKQELILPDKVSSVGAYAFAGTQIEDLEIPDGITTIGDHAFADTPIQDHVTIPDGIKELGEGAFRNSKLATVFLPNSITSVSRDLFQGCTNLNKVYIPDNFTEVSGYAFDGCEALKILRLSANTASMGEYAFQSAPMTKITVPSQVEVLPRGVFKNCKNLVSVSLPANLTTVENEAFYGCTALRNLSIEAIEPPTISNRSAIRGINTDLCIISIPTQSYRAYVLADYWGQFVEMRNDIAVETAGNGEIAFESVVEGEDEGVAESRTRSGQLATEDDAQTSISNGSSVYVPQDGQVRFYITPAKGETLLSATLDGVDITNDIVDGVYVATADKKNAKLVVKFSGTAPEPETYDITFDGSDSWATYVAQVDLALPTGITAYTVTSIETTSVTATAINYIPKDIPVLLKREDTNTNLYQASAGEGTAPTTNLLKVYDTDKTVSNREGYVLYKDEFVLVNAGTLPAGKVFLPANDSGSASTRSIVIEGEGTTGINSSILRNADGSNGLLYDLQGRKLSGKPVQKGVYILNGRKVVVK